MKTKINLEGLAPSKETFQPVSPPPPPKPVRPDPELEYWLLALESPKGILIECATPKEASAKRFRLYRSRARQQKAGNFSLDPIVIQMDGAFIKLALPASVVVSQL